MKPMRGKLIAKDIQVKVAWRVKFGENMGSKKIKLRYSKSYNMGSRLN